MVRISIILFAWALIGFRLNLQWSDLYELTYSITIMLSSIALSISLKKNHAKYMLFPFMFSLPIFISDVLNYVSPNIGIITDVISILSALIILTYLLNSLKNGIIR